MAKEKMPQDSNVEKKKDYDLKPSNYIEVTEYVEEDPTKVVGLDPNYHPYWDSMEDMRKRGGRPLPGFAVVQGNQGGKSIDPEIRLIADTNAPRGTSNQDTTRTNGDAILTCCRKEFYEDRKRKQRELAMSKVTKVRDAKDAREAIVDSMRRSGLSRDEVRRQLASVDKNQTHIGRHMM